MPLDLGASGGACVDASATISSAAFASPDGDETATSCSTSGSAREAIARRPASAPFGVDRRSQGSRGTYRR